MTDKTTTFGKPSLQSVSDQIVKPPATTANPSPVGLSVNLLPKPILTEQFASLPFYEKLVSAITVGIIATSVFLFLNSSVQGVIK